MRGPQRHSVADKPQVEQLSREELIALVRELQRQIGQLREENERLKRSQRRQAAPFSKEKPVKDPKKPGRKKGQGRFRRRQTPVEEPNVTVDAQAPPCCPYCGGPLEQDGVEYATTTDVPEQPKPNVTQYRVAVCHCLGCGKKVRGTAPGLAADQYGATAHRVGPAVMAAAHALHYGVGVPQRKIPAVLKELTGVSITQSALAQDALRRAKGEVGAQYQQLREAIQEAPFVHTDDTGWRVGGRTAFLMGFDTDRATIYQIRSQHRNEEVREVIPSNYAGVMVSDRGKSYDAEEFNEVEQQKCLGHILRNISDVVITKQGRAREFGSKAKTLFQDGMELWRARHCLTEDVFAEKADKLKQQVTHHLRNRILKDDDNQRLLNGLGIQDDRGHLTRFLSVPFVEPTNNRAERMLRPAVIARKVSQCSKNQDGADAFAAFTSVAQTALKNGAVSITAAFRQLFSASKAISDGPVE
jgi:transposase